MIRRRFLQLLAGAVVGTAAVLHIPGSVVGRTAIGRRAACDVLRKEYLDHVHRYGVEPQLLVAERDLFDAYGSELTANERFVSALSPRDAYNALLPEHMLFKGTKVVASPRAGWSVRCW